MKQRPRQIDCTKPVLISLSLEAFNNADGQEAETKNTDKIITPDMLLNEKPKQFTEPTLKSQQPHKCREDYIQFRNDVYPDATSYELSEEDVHYLQTINENLAIPISIIDFEQYLALLDTKSGKDVEIDFTEFQKLKLNLPKTINQQAITVQEQIHVYFKKQRQNFSRPLTRFLMHPYYEDNNPHLAFRPRSQPTDRTMKLRRGNAQNQRGIAEMENLGQKIVLLKKDLQMVSTLISQSLQREKALEIERRFNFCKFITDFFGQQKREKEVSSEIKLWSKDCFTKDCQERCVINVLERGDEMFDQISKEIITWKETNEIQRKDKIKKEDAIQRYEKQIDELIAEKLKFEEKPPMLQTQFIPPKPEVVQQPIYPQEPPDERMESVARFLATIYLEARKYQFTFDSVMNETFPIYKIQQQLKPLNSKSIFPYSLMQLEENDIVYKVRKDNMLKNNDQQFWDNHQDTTQQTLYNQHTYFREKLGEIMELADMDQMLYGQGVEDDKLDEEEQKLWKKKVKVNQGRNPPQNGNQVMK